MTEHVDLFLVGPSGLPSGEVVMDVFDINRNKPWENPPISIRWPHNNDIQKE